MKRNKIGISCLVVGILLIAACGGNVETTANAKLSAIETVKEEKQEEPKAEPSATKKLEIPEPTIADNPEIPEPTIAENLEIPELSIAEKQEEPEPETLGNPRSSYGLGSASFLEGDNILVSLFVTTPESSWEEEEKQKMLKRVQVAADYIEQKAKAYGTEVRFYYNYEDDSSLYQEEVVDFCINEETDFIDRLDEEIARWFEEKIDYDELLEAFDAEGIATMVFVNNPGVSYAIVYDGTDNVKESLVLFSKDYYNEGKEERPITYAHEILHLFGAHDLYEEAEFTQEVTEYVKAVYPREIMLTVTGGENTDTAVSAELSPITAYHLGWIDDIEELAKFPQLQRE